MRIVFIWCLERSLKKTRPMSFHFYFMIKFYICKNCCWAKRKDWEFWEKWHFLVNLLKLCDMYVDVVNYLLNWVFNIKIGCRFDLWPWSETLYGMWGHKTQKIQYLVQSWFNGSNHRWELPGNYPVFTVVMVIYHYVERIWRIIVTPIFYITCMIINI